MPMRETAVEGMLSWVQYAATAIEILAVAIIVLVILFATLSYSLQIMARQADTATYIIRTVVIEPTLNNVLVLGLLVLIRTFLSWSLVLEIEERWPWQPSRTGTKDYQA